MLAEKEYTEMTSDELLSAERKAKSQGILNALLAGVVFGVAVYSATHHKGFIITVLLLIIPFWIGRKNAQNLENIRAEMNRRETAAQ